jgi:hypothetical protein
MAVSDVDICNLALSRLSATPIVTIGEATVNGELCQRFYAVVYDRVLRAHNWKSAIERVTLGQVTAPIMDDYDFAYQLPPDCLRVMHINKQDDAFTVEGRKLLTNRATVIIKYVSRTATGNLDPSLLWVMYLTLAIELSLPVTGDKETKESLYKELIESAWPDATMANVIEELEEDFDKKHSSWIDSRQ